MASYVHFLRCVGKARLAWGAAAVVLLCLIVGVAIFAISTRGTPAGRQAEVPDGTTG